MTIDTQPIEVILTPERRIPATNWPSKLELKPEDYQYTCPHCGQTDSSFKQHWCPGTY